MNICQYLSGDCNSWKQRLNVCLIARMQYTQARRMNSNKDHFAYLQFHRSSSHMHARNCRHGSLACHRHQRSWSKFSFHLLLSVCSIEMHAARQHRRGNQFEIDAHKYRFQLPFLTCRSCRTQQSSWTCVKNGEETKSYLQSRSQLRTLNPQPGVSLYLRRRHCRLLRHGTSQRTERILPNVINCVDK